MIAEGAEEALRAFVAKTHSALAEARMWLEGAEGGPEQGSATVAVIALEQAVHTSQRCWVLVTGEQWSDPPVKG